MRPKTLDHVALWVADRDAITDFLTERLSMHVIERTDKFTLVGTNARRGKLTLFGEEGPREQGALKHVALRVNDLGEALGGLEGIDGRPRERRRIFRRRSRAFGSGSSRRRPTSSTTSTTWRSSRRARTRRRASTSSSASRPTGEDRVEVGGAFVEFHDGEPGSPNGRC